jgi:hypothetical protein
MVKITEDWLTVEDGTKLYTKTWEVGQYKVSFIRLFFLYQSSTVDNFLWFYCSGVLDSWRHITWKHWSNKYPSQI